MGINLSELLVVFVVALLLFGPEQLPALARHVGRITGELRKGSDALRREFYNTVYPPDVAQDLKQGMRTLHSLKAQVLAPPTGSAPVSSRTPPSQPEDTASQQADNSNNTSSSTGADSTTRQISSTASPEAAPSAPLLEEGSREQ